MFIVTLIAYSDIHDIRFQKNKNDKVYISYRYNKLIEAINQYMCGNGPHIYFLCKQPNNFLFKNLY